MKLYQKISKNKGRLPFTKAYLSTLNNSLFLTKKLSTYLRLTYHYIIIIPNPFRLLLPVHRPLILLPTSTSTIINNRIIIN